MTWQWHYLIWLIPLTLLVTMIWASGWKPNLPWSKVGSFLGGVIVLVLVCWGGHKGYKWWTTKPSTSPTQAATNTNNSSVYKMAKKEDAPNVIYAVTPVAITADYEFNIESDGPIMVQFPGEKPVEYIPGKGYTKLPQPKFSGPKIFTDPKDPENGRVPFRLYPVQNGW